MSQDKKPEPGKDTSQPGREEEVIKNKDLKKDEDSSSSGMTQLPGNPGRHNRETEGERRFKEGLANNSDTKDS